MHAGCVFVAGIHPSRTWMSGSFESMRWNECVHRTVSPQHSTDWAIPVPTCCPEGGEKVPGLHWCFPSSFTVCIVLEVQFRMKVLSLLLWSCSSAGTLVVTIVVTFLHINLIIESLFWWYYSVLRHITLFCIVLDVMHWTAYSAVDDSSTSSALGMTQGNQNFS